MRSKSVQFDNPEDVVQAYKLRKVPAWAIFHNNEGPMFKYDQKNMSEGEQLLSQTLETLERSAACYSFRIYEDLPAGGKIKSNSVHDGAFNFQLNDNPRGYLPPEIYQQAGVNGGVKVMLTEFQALKTENAQLKAKLAEDDGEDSQLGIVGELLEHEAIAPVVPLLVDRLMDLFLPEKPVARQAAISGVVFAGTEQEKLTEAITILASAVTDLPDVLLKLARLSQNKPTKFQYYVTMMRAIKV